MAQRGRPKTQMLRIVVVYHNGVEEEFKAPSVEQDLQGNLIIMSYMKNPELIPLQGVRRYKVYSA